MTKAIDDIKKIRDALNEIFEPRSTIASNSSPKPVNEPRSSSISGSSSSKEDMAMNNLNLYAKKLQNDPDNLNLEDAIQTVIWSDRKSTRLNSSHVALSRMPSSA